MWILQEPMWGKNLLLWMHQLMQNPFLFQWIPVLADVFVFVYPVYLVVLYVYAMVYKVVVQKQSALWIFFAAMISMVFNMIVQLFVVKDRPDVVMDLLYQKKEDLILYNYLPEWSFPSDHVTMGVTIAMATLLWGLRYKKKWYVYFSLFLFAIAIVMWWARITIGIHRPTDVIGGCVVGIAIPLILFHKKIYPYLQSWAIDPLIRVEEWVWKKIFG